MNKIFFLLACILTISCTSKHDTKYQNSNKIVISGKIRDFDLKESNVELLIYRLGFKPERINAEIDSSGYFNGSFESDIPTDLRLRHKTVFFVLTHPGDSIYIEIDGKLKTRSDILRTIKFSGDAEKTNQDAASFQNLYFSSNLFLDQKTKNKAINQYDVHEFVKHLDTVHIKTSELLSDFSNKFSPNNEAKKWAQIFIEQQEYFDPLCFYPQEHQNYNNLKSKNWSVPSSYYDHYLKRLPISDSMFISAFALNSFVNRYSSYISNKKHEENEQYVFKDDYVFFIAPKEIADSISIYNIIKYTQDPLLKQLSLVELFESHFKKSEIDLFEKYRFLVDSLITKPYLKAPLLIHYNQTKASLDNPNLTSEIILHKLDNSSAKQILDSVKIINKGKVVYLDFWATWCGPCKAELPNSINLMHKMKGKDVAFVYFCLDSKEKQWKSTLSELQLKGQHYFLTKEQSKDIRESFNIGGIPYYVLMGRKGEISEKGSHLRPNAVEEKIEILLDE